MAVNFTKYQDEITKAWREVADSNNFQKWALFTYEGTTNVIKLMATGSRGLDELVEEFNCSLIQYAFCRVIDDSVNLNKLILINWQGDSAPLSRKGLCASHVGDVVNYFKGCTQTITIRNDDEATKEHLMEQILRTSASKLSLSCLQQTQTSSPSLNHSTRVQTRNETNENGISSKVSSSPTTTPPAPTSSVYKKVDIGSDIAASRKTFWQRQEEEERERIADEKRRAAERQAQFEKERKHREELEAKKLAETIRERDRLIEATREADKYSADSSQQSSIVSTTTDPTEDDGRVGRRSELMRLERNQETQSLISKGLIKNKRAIFEQAQQQQQNTQPTLTRRTSGAVVGRRVNAFKSLDVISNNSILTNTNDGSTSVNSVGKLSDNFGKQLNVNGDGEKSKTITSTVDSIPVSDTATIKKETEPVLMTRESDEQTSSNTSVDSNTVKSPDQGNTPQKELEDLSVSSSLQPHENGLEKIDGDHDFNGNNENSFSKKSPISEIGTTGDVITNEELIMNGKNSDIKAIALFDYQAADNTEISFDPDDQIGHIQKVDPGWWHGQVISGRFKGQIGLFPANYVQEL